MEIICLNTIYNPISVLSIQVPDNIEQTSMKDLQIFGGLESFHWRCLYYDLSNLHIYDSLYWRTLKYDDLCDDEKEYILYRYGIYNSNDIIIEKMNVIQPDFISCGVYAAAFATSIILNKNPCNVCYSLNVKSMKIHFFENIKRRSS